ncbi:MAG: transporter [Gammaproteobacteria bacterium]|nr:transporter [Gammaproteobacteria bacterium]
MALSCSLAWSNSPQAAPITFNTALPVARGVFMAREQLVVHRSGEDPSEAQRERTEVAAISVLGYGITNRWALFGELAYRDIDLDRTTDGQRISRSTSGFGDLSLLARHTAYRHDRLGQTLRVAPFAGIKAPTGEHDDRDSHGRLPASVQAGTGSWDYFGGIVMTYQTLRYQMDGQIAYRENTVADDFEAGDVWRLDGSLQYRLHPLELAGGVPAFIYGVLEANLVHEGRNRIDGRRDPDSGGTRFFLTPGLQYVGRRWLLEGALQVPVAQNLNGGALETDYLLRAGVRFNF